jgi:hypothetical protein
MVRGLCNPRLATRNVARVWTAAGAEERSFAGGSACPKQNATLATAKLNKPNISLRPVLRRRFGWLRYGTGSLLRTIRFVIMRTRIEQEDVAEYENSINAFSSFQGLVNGWRDL